MLLSINFDLSLIDMDGIIVAFVGYLIVFVALICLYFVFNTIPIVLKISQRRKLKAQGREECADKEPVTGEMNAAIAMALYLYFNENHDEESNVMTIKKISKVYTPWSSKIYGLRSYDKPYKSSTIK